MNTKERFTTAVQEQFSFTPAEANRIYAIYTKERVLILGHGGSGFSLAHGAFWDRSIMENALTQDH